MKFRLLILLLFIVGGLGITPKVCAQDPVFSQFYNSPVYLNPALIGEEEYMMFNFASRSQWRSLEYPYTTHQASLIIPYFQNKHLKPQGHLGGVGVSFYGDKAGIHSNFKSYGGNASFAYNLNLSTKNVNRITFALQAGFIHKNVDKSNLEWGEQYNPFIGFDNTVVPADINNIESRTFMDITAGAFWRYYANHDSKIIQSVYAGFVAAHLNNPDESILLDQTNRLPVLYKLHGGVIFGLSPKTSISFNYLSQLQDLVNQTNFGSFVSHKLPFNTKGKMTNFLGYIGAWYRVQDSFIANLGFRTDHLGVGFSYDWNVTSLRYNNRGTGSFEITMYYRFFEPAPPKVRY